MSPNGVGDSAQVGGDRRTLVRQLFDIADLEVCRHDPRPFRARPEEPAAAPGQARRVKGIARNQELHMLPAAQVRANLGAHRRAIVPQEENLERIPR